MLQKNIIKHTLPARSWTVI